MNNNEKAYPKMLAKAYDLVCNGYEMGGGSIRIYRNEIQQAVFRDPREERLVFGIRSSGDGSGVGHCG